MSRTYRTQRLALDIDHKHFPCHDNRFYRYYKWGDKLPLDHSKYNYKCDCKPCDKPHKKFKKIMTRNRKAKERIAMQKKDYDNIPRFSKMDIWEWL
jgi:hypothetical protein